MKFDEAVNNMVEVYGLWDQMIPRMVGRWKKATSKNIEDLEDPKNVDELISLVGKRLDMADEKGLRAALKRYLRKELQDA